MCWSLLVLLVFLRGERVAEENYFPLSLDGEVKLASRVVTDRIPIVG